MNESLQSAYKKHHSCETALLRVQNDILKSIDDKQCVVLLLLDLSVVMMAPIIGNQSERSKFGLDQSESRISPMWLLWRHICPKNPRDPME